PFVDDLHGAASGRSLPAACATTTDGRVLYCKTLVGVLRGAAAVGDRRWCLEDTPGQTLLRARGTRGNPTSRPIVVSSQHTGGDAHFHPAVALHPSMVDSSEKRDADLLGASSGGRGCWLENTLVPQVLQAPDQRCLQGRAVMLVKGMRAEVVVA